MKLNRNNLIPLCTSHVSTHMAKLGAHLPLTRYMARSIKIDANNEVDSGIVRTLCSFLTGSGFAREIEIPVVIHKGAIVDPSVAIVHGSMEILSSNLIQGISEAGSVTEKMRVGSMYSTAYAGSLESYKELVESMPYVPRLYRPMY